MATKFPVSEDVPFMGFFYYLILSFLCFIQPGN